MTILETARLKLPLLATGQAHKELFHNEALVRLDCLIHPVVQAVETDPATLTPQAGQAWVVGSGGTGDWLGHDDEIAAWTGNGWHFTAPPPLMRVYIESTDDFAIFRGTWQVSGVVESPTAGAVIDVEARAAIESILASLEMQGIVESSP